MELPEVEQVVVMGQGEQTELMAYVVGASVPEVTEMRSHLLSRLPDYMVPSQFMKVDSLPLTPSGKLDRRALAQSGADS